MASSFATIAPPSSLSLAMSSAAGVGTARPLWRRDISTVGMDSTRLLATLLAGFSYLVTAAGYPGNRPQGDFLSQRVINGSQRNAVKPTYTLSYRERVNSILRLLNSCTRFARPDNTRDARLAVYLEEACGGLAAKAQRSHYLSLRDQKASMAIYSHRSGVLAAQREQVPHPDTDRIYMTDKPDLVCGKHASGKSISTTTSQMALEWVINNGGEKPGRIEMILTSYKDSWYASVTANSPADRRLNFNVQVAVF
ncbi:hypothetical protein HPB51_009186 [Rhipicephalus microplus]|uniref:Uncharacterized protein n=1 Tax=Rhipicephalus microplus TaxID=6941 RepID=A0A9J6EZN4_RHIMP|nr:hypothetical protein HPB51_009186 [Rhipicephalus microplus]